MFNRRVFVAIDVLLQHRASDRVADLIERALRKRQEARELTVCVDHAPSGPLRIVVGTLI